MEGKVRELREKYEGCRLREGWWEDRYNSTNNSL